MSHYTASEDSWTDLSVSVQSDANMIRMDDGNAAETRAV